MQLRVARLCLDCEEVHESQVCPVCASESFAFISRWIEVPERRRQPRPTPKREPSDNGKPASKSVAATVARGAAGLAALTFAGWLWQRTKSPAPAETTEESETAEPQHGSGD
jgi:hypothetical protein